MTTKIPIRTGLRIMIPMALGLILVVIGAVPAPAQGFSVSFDDVEFVVAPGDNFTAVLHVLNTADEQRTLRVYVGDWVRVPGRTSGYEFEEEQGLEARSFLDWMMFSPERLVIEPGEMSDVYCEVHIPDDPTVEGSYWGVVFIEAVPSEDPALNEAGDDEVAIGITTVFRYAIQIYATVENTEIRDATFTSVDFRQAEGGFDVIAVFENLGNIYMRPEVWVELRDTNGEVILRQDYIRQTVLPESAREYIFELRDLQIESGSYLVMVLADFGIPALIAVQGRIDITVGEPESSEDQEQ